MAHPRSDAVFVRVVGWWIRVMNILIGGNAYGYGNIGDDAVLAGIVAALDAVQPGCELTIESCRGGELEFVGRPHRGIRAGDWTAFAAALEACDVFVVGGGTMIGDELSLAYPLIHGAQRVASAAMLGKRTVFWCCGANRVSSETGQRITHGLIKASAWMSFRDAASADLCRSYRQGAFADIRAYSDPAYLVKPQASARTDVVMRRLRRHGKTIGINLLNEVWGGQPGYKQAVAAACNRVCDQTGAVPVFFANEVRPGAFYDLMANLEATRWLECPYEILYPEYYTPQEMLEIIAGFSAVFSMRMHPLIFASSVGVPFDGISRADKMDNFFGRFGRRSCCRINDVKADIVFEAMIRLLREPRGILPQVALFRAEALQCAKDFFDKVGVMQGCVRCPLEILRYAPCGSKMRKLACYLSCGSEGVKELLRR